jgi:hypothetical protein
VICHTLFSSPAPAGRPPRGRAARAAAAALATAALALAGCSSHSGGDSAETNAASAGSSATASPGQSTSPSATESAAAAAASQQADPQADASAAVRAAVDRTLLSGPVRMTSTSPKGNSEAQADVPQRIMLATLNLAGTSVTLYVRGDEILMRPAGSPTWFRAPDNPQASAAVANAFSAESIRALAESGQSRRAGRETVNGVETTRYVETLDKEAAADRIIAALGDAAGDRASVIAGFPDELVYWIDDRGILVRHQSGETVTDYSDVGKPIDLPQIAPGDIQQFPAG